MWLRDWPASKDSPRVSDLASYFQSLVICLTPFTICLGVIFVPDGNLRGSLSPLARTLMWVPPTSIASTFTTSPHSETVCYRTVSSGRTKPKLQLATAFLSTALLDAITVMSSFQDFTN